MNPDRSQNGQEEEYENEEQLATVTVVEDFDLQALIQEPPRPPQHPSEDIDRIKHTTPSRQNDDTGRQKRPKVRKIHYETKSARNAERKKQRARQKEKADRAGERRGKKPGIRKKGSK